MSYHVGQQVEYLTLDRQWISYTIVKEVSPGVWGIQGTHGDAYYSTERWIRPVPALRQLAEAAE